MLVAHRVDLRPTPVLFRDLGCCFGCVVRTVKCVCGAQGGFATHSSSIFRSVVAEAYAAWFFDLISGPPLPLVSLNEHFPSLSVVVSCKHCLAYLHKPVNILQENLFVNGRNFCVGRKLMIRYFVSWDLYFLGFGKR